MEMKLIVNIGQIFINRLEEKWMMKLTYKVRTLYYLAFNEE
ncbi:hypothetical protein KsCSTR_16420 [Candidatus Kuenenia stuttgartiensis]|uniref:Uncharacterized protein n=1 Tax=Kuenenia stuttgartiensis TaxID=174633 RepID=A0A6G7GNL1_KUEST|nr:hypothetical protein KsCSTR_16420 [Candidatus Kuenenia stuttgartiensis]